MATRAALLLMAGILAGCASSDESQPQTVRLSRSQVALRGTDTSQVVEASLTGTTGCRMMDVYSTGDSSVICFRLLEDSSEVPLHHICITAHPEKARPDSNYTCTLHFTMQGHMTYMQMRMGGDMHDRMTDMMEHQASLSVTYRR